MQQPDTPKRVLFVCTGNTCRSPMAEGLLKVVIENNRNIEVSSAGVAAMPGQPASRETQQVLKKKNASLKGFKSRQVDEEILSQADLIITMTSSHAELLKGLFAEVSDAVKLLSDFISPSQSMADVPDPIGMGGAAYEKVAEMIELAIPGICAEINNSNA